MFLSDTRWGDSHPRVAALLDGFILGLVMGLTWGYAIWGCGS
jgi:hypothetical protein